MAINAISAETSLAHLHSIGSILSMGVVSSRPPPDYSAYDKTALTVDNFPNYQGMAPRSDERFKREDPPKFLPVKESVMKIPQGASRLTTADLLDRIAGAIFGNCIGDAVGLATEFMNRKQAAAAYGVDIRDIKVFSGFKRHLHMQYTDFVKDRHRARFPTGDWTDDSDQMLCIMESLLHHGGELHIHDIAYRILCVASTVGPH